MSGKKKEKKPEKTPQKIVLPQEGGRRDYSIRNT